MDVQYSEALYLSWHHHEKSWNLEFGVVRIIHPHRSEKGIKSLWKCVIQSVVDALCVRGEIATFAFVTLRNIVKKFFHIDLARINLYLYLQNYAQCDDQPHQRFTNPSTWNVSFKAKGRPSILVSCRWNAAWERCGGVQLCGNFPAMAVGMWVRRLLRKSYFISKESNAWAECEIGRKGLWVNLPGDVFLAINDNRYYK